MEEDNAVDKLSKDDNKDNDVALVFPTDINLELEIFGINKRKIAEIIKTNTKWKIAEYILWLRDGIKKGKVKDPAGLFVFAITDEMVKVKSTHPHIHEFIDNLRRESEDKLAINIEMVNKEYKKYINKELKLFEKEDEFAYIASRTSVHDDLEAVYKKRVKSQKQLYNMATTQDEKDKMMITIEKWEEFPIKRYDSEIFMEQFIKKIKLYRGLKDFEDFKREYINKNR